jgi:hypothetical protein
MVLYDLMGQVIIVPHIKDCHNDILFYLSIDFYHFSIILFLLAII